MVFLLVANVGVVPHPDSALAQNVADQIGVVVAALGASSPVAVSRRVRLHAVAANNKQWKTVAVGDIRDWFRRD